MEKNIDNIQFGYWHPGARVFVPIEGMTRVGKEYACGLLGLTHPGLDALVAFSKSIVKWVGKDLADIQQRLDEAGL